MSKHTHKREAPELLLQNAGLKKTKARLAILTYLQEHPIPHSPEDISRALINSTDTSTIYRSLETLESCRIITRIDFKKGRAYYEIVDPDHHHHHITCTDCGMIEDVPVCDVEMLIKKALSKTKTFDSIHTHTLEFFGHCSRCKNN